MEETIKKEEQTYTPVNLNRKVPPYFLFSAIVVLVIGVLAYLTFFQKLLPFKFVPTKTSIPTETPKVTIKTVPYEQTNGKGVQVYLSGTEGAVEVPAFQLELSLPQIAEADNVIVKINPQLESQGWKFPIARFENENSRGLVKISGYRLGNSPYEIKGNLLIVTITTKDNEILPFEVNQENTVLYSSDAVTKIPFNTQSE
jgi:hypothetical protein